MTGRLMNRAAVLMIASSAALTVVPTGAEALDAVEKLAAALTVNDLVAVDGGYQLHHPRHRATFLAGGIRISPPGGSPMWAWRLDRVGAERSLDSVVPDEDPEPVRLDDLVVRYERVALDEEYVLGPSSIEQRFMLHLPPDLDGRNLVIEGVVDCDGELRAGPRGWEWVGESGLVRLGTAVVFDADGVVLPSRFTVTAANTRLVVDGSALAGAAYPVTIDPEIGANDFRISTMGPDGDTVFRAICPSVAYNETDHEYLVVWQGTDDRDGLVPGEFEIFGQILDADGGAILADDFRISDVGGTGLPYYGAMDPDVVWNGTDNVYLVVWDADDPEGGVGDEEFEIWGQLLNADGGEVGPNDFRISFMDPDGDHAYDARFPAVAHNPDLNQYLVTWHGDTGTDGLVDDELEIWARLVASDGTPIGSQIQVSDMGPPGSPDFIAQFPDVIYNSEHDEYLIVWRGGDDGGGMVVGEREIFGRLLTADGFHVSPDDQRISDAGGSGDVNVHVHWPAVAYNPVANEYLVAWSGEDDVGGLVSEDEVFIQRLSSELVEVGTNDQRISDMGGIGLHGYEIRQGLDVSYGTATGEYAVVWAGDDEIDGVAHGEFEVYGQLLLADGTEIGLNDMRLSDIAGSGIQTYGPHIYTPAAVAASSSTGELLTVWSADDPDGGCSDDEFEIFGQLWFRTEILIDGFESGDTSAWSSTVP